MQVFESRSKIEGEGDVEGVSVVNYLIIFFLAVGRCQRKIGSLCHRNTLLPCGTTRILLFFFHALH